MTSWNIPNSLEASLKYAGNTTDKLLVGENAMDKFSREMGRSSWFISALRFLRLIAKFPRFGPRTSTTPSATIVIPTYENFLLTVECLLSLSRHDSSETYEVLVVDDASPSRQDLLFKLVPGLRVTRTPENLGFIGASHWGVKHAQGHLVVLLNNDTRVLDGWLDALVKEFLYDTEEKIGLVGSLLINPQTNKVSDGGAVVFSNGLTTSYGDGFELDDPRVRYRRQVDYVAGASMCFRKQDFNELLDELPDELINGYYDDVDLAFRFRKKGKQVVFQPRSQAFHHRNATYFKIFDGSPIELIARNHSVFLAIWRRELNSDDFQDAPGNPALGARRLEGTRGTVVILDNSLGENAPLSGHSRNSLAHFLVRNGYSVVLVAGTSKISEASRQRLRDLGVCVFSREDDYAGFLAEISTSIAAVVTSGHPEKFDLSALAHLIPKACFIVNGILSFPEIRLKRLTVKSGRRLRDGGDLRISNKHILGLLLDHDERTST